MLDRGEEVSGVGERGEDRLPGEHADVVEREHVVRVRHRDDDLAAPTLDRQRAVAARDLFGDHAREQDVGRVGLEVDERDAEVVGEGLRELEARDRADVDERFAEALAGRALVFERALEIVLGDEAAVDHRLAEPGDRVRLRWAAA